MVRKQIFIDSAQDRALKRLSAKTGRSEGALIREMIDLRVRQDVDDEEAWQDLVKEWQARPLLGGPRDWTRDDLYAERVTRYDNPR